MGDQNSSDMKNDTKQEGTEKPSEQSSVEDVKAANNSSKQLTQNTNKKSLEESIEEDLKEATENNLEEDTAQTNSKRLFSDDKENKKFKEERDEVSFSKWVTNEVETLADDLSR